MQHLKDWKIHHKTCYGCMIISKRLGTDDLHHSEKYAIDGITMTQIMDKYKQKNIDTEDKALLKQLTTDISFCSYCYKPYLPNELCNELITPFMTLLDLVSGLTFVFVPIVWIALSCVFGVLAFGNYILERCCSTKEDNEHTEYAKFDFDREYFPNQFKMANI